MPGTDRPPARRSIAALAVTLALVVGTPFAYYYLVFVPTRRHAAIESNFRALAAMGVNLQRQVGAFADVLGNYKPYKAVLSSGGRRDATSVAKSSVGTIVDPRLFIASLVPQLHRHLPGDCIPAGDHAGDPTAGVTGPHARLILAGPGVAKQGLFFRTKLPPSELDGKSDAVTCGQVSFEDIMHGIAVDNAFDSLFIALVDGTILYQDGKTALRLRTLDDGAPGVDDKRTAGGAAHAKDDPSPKAKTVAAGQASLTRSAITDKVLGDATYRVFTLPVQLDVPIRRFDDSRATTPEDYQCLLGGIVSEKRLEHDARAISFEFTGLLWVLCLLGIVSWPLFKLWSMHSRQPLTAVDIHMLSAAVVLVNAILTFCALDAAWYLWLGSRIDHTLETVAGRVIDHLRDETGAAQQTLNDFGERAHFADGGAPPFYERHSILREATFTYPFFQMLVAVGASGMHREKWTIQEHGTPQIDISELDFFKQARRGPLWQWHDAGPDGTGFVLDVIKSPNSGETLPLLAMPVARDDAAALAGGARDDLPVEVIVPDLLSINQPVLPAGMAFAFVDRDGQVILHSDLARSRQENVFQECSVASEIRAATVADRAEFLTGDYHGKAHRIYVRPVPGIPASLVVFYDLDVPRTLNGQVLMTCAIVFIALTALYVVGFLLAYILWLGSDARYGCPDPTRTRTYVVASVVLLLLATLFGAGIASFHALATLAAICIVPILALIFIVLLLEGGRALGRVGRAVAAVAFALAALDTVALYRNQEGAVGGAVAAAVVVAMVVALVRERGAAHARGTWRPEWAIRSYVVAGLLLVVNLAVLPAIGVFTDASRQATEMLVHAEELHFATALAARVDRARRLYLPVDTDLDAIVAQRLGVDWDVYGIELADRPETFSVLRAYDMPCDEPPSVRHAFPLLAWMTLHACDGLRGDRSPCASARRHFTGPLFEALPEHEGASGVLTRMIHDHASDGRWRHFDEADTMSLEVRDPRFAYYVAGLDGARTAVRVDVDAPKVVGLPGRFTRSVMLWAAFAVAILAFAGYRRLADPVFGFGPDGDASLEPIPPPVRFTHEVLREECSWTEPLRKIGHRLENDPELSTTSPEQLLDRIGSLAEAHYRALWNDLPDDDDRLVLVQLARHGLVNPRNWDRIRCLRARGLVRRAPFVRPMNETFRRFLLTVVPAADVARWESSGATGATSWTRGVFLAALAAAGMFLFMAQRPLFDAGVALITALAATLPALGRYVGLTRVGDAKDGGG